MKKSTTSKCFYKMQKFSNEIFTVDNFTESSEKFTGRLCGIVVKVVRLRKCKHHMRRTPHCPNINPKNIVDWIQTIKCRPRLIQTFVNNFRQQYGGPTFDFLKELYVILLTHTFNTCTMQFKPSYMLPLEGSEQKKMFPIHFY